MVIMIIKTPVYYMKSIMYLTTSASLFLYSPSILSAGCPMAMICGFMSNHELRDLNNIYRIYIIMCNAIVHECTTCRQIKCLCKCVHVYILME